MMKKKSLTEQDKKSCLISISNKLKDREVVQLIHLARGVVIPAASADQVRGFLDLVTAMETHRMLDEDMKNWAVLYDMLQVIKRKDLAQNIEKFAKNYNKRKTKTVSLLQNPFVSLLSEASDKIEEATTNVDSIACTEILQHGDYTDLWKGIMDSDRRVQIEITKSSAPLKTLSSPGLIQSRLKHENIVEVLRICRNHDPTWVVLEWMDKGELQSFVRSAEGRSLTGTDFIDFSSQIANGMLFLEQKNIVHCCLKASNIFVSDQMVLKVGGFFLAKHIGDAKVCNLEEEISPPIRWSPPEVIFHRQISRRSDIWSFGIVVVELFSRGEVPYQGIEKRDLVLKLRAGYHPEQPSECPNAFYRLIKGCWQVDYLRPSFEEILPGIKMYKDTNEYSESPSGWTGTSPAKRISLADAKRKQFQNRDSNVYSTSIDKTEELPLPEWTDEIKLKRDSINLKELIGSGEFGLVWRASLLPNDTDIAAKQITVPLKDTQEFLKEVEIMKKFSHPHLLKLIGISIDQPPIYIITELMSSGNLLNFLRRETGMTISPHDLLLYALQVADAMAYIEKNRCIHRDIAARNVFMKNERTVKLGDFGLSRSLSSSHYQAAKDVRFPLRWTAPEAIQWQKFSIKSDVWSYGILLVEIITRGKTPYEELSNEEVLTIVKNGYTHPQPELCPDDVYEAMVSCWKKEEESRPSFKELYQTMKKLREKSISQVTKC